jgi:hypothetical protein
VSFGYLSTEHSVELTANLPPESPTKSTPPPSLRLPLPGGYVIQARSTRVRAREDRRPTYRPTTQHCCAAESDSSSTSASSAASPPRPPAALSGGSRSTRPRCGWACRDRRGPSRWSRACPNQNRPPPLQSLPIRGSRIRRSPTRATSVIHEPSGLLPPDCPPPRESASRRDRRPPFVLAVAHSSASTPGRNRVQGNPDRPIRIVVESISSRRREALADVEAEDADVEELGDEEDVA